MLTRSSRAVAAAVALFVLILVACSSPNSSGTSHTDEGSGSGPASHDTVTPAGWIRHSFHGASIAVPSDWQVLDQENSPKCPTYSANTLELGHATDLACTANIQTETNQYVRIGIYSQPQEPVLTTIMGMTMSNEPVNGYSAERLHLVTEHTASGDRQSQSIYISELAVDVDVSFPAGSDLADQVLQTLLKH